MLAVIAIQFVMRQCFFVSNLLLAPTLPSPPAVAGPPALQRSADAALLDSLVVMGGVSLAILFLIRKAEPIGLTGLGRALLAFLALVQILLLPVTTAS